MSDTSTPRPSGMRIEVVVIGVVALLAALAVAYVTSQRQQELRSSPAGLDGLQVWLSAQGGEAIGFSGGWMLDSATIGLLIMPLYDTEPDVDHALPRTKEELLYQQDENDLDWWTVETKIDQVPTLVVLPKWRSGMRLTGIAHPALLIEEARLNRMLQGLLPDEGLQVNRIRRVFTRLPYTSATGQALEAELYAAQLFDSKGCDPIIGSGRETLLASCPTTEGGSTVMVLSDPDLLNNHGLRLADNAAIAKDLLLPAAGEGRVVIDYSLGNWLSDWDETVTRERTWADLLRFFEPPFLAMWLGAGLTLALALWRSFRRAGPLAAAAGTGTGKMQAIGARARLMRMTGQDGAMVADYAAARIAATAARLVGPGQARQIGEEQAFLRYLARRRPEQSARLAGVLERLHALPPGIAAGTAIQHVDDLEQVLELIANDT